jgi:hypothetical protein
MGGQRSKEDKLEREQKSWRDEFENEYRGQEGRSEVKRGQVGERAEVMVVRTVE